MIKKERDVANDLTRILKGYPLLTPSMNAERGWPDKLIQLPKSVVVACEIKVVTANQSNYYLLSELRQEQAAWLAKWVYHGGLGFVFVGINNEFGFMGYHCKTMNWDNWILANKQQYQAINVMHEIAVLQWFEDWVINA